ncbi:hypothetical protein PoB_005557800 [Plakobranchus ocellatus]|uniref:Uncharacterized protein n=1 Tax=Plakobranchus ocellatus TaxID=259542 RepID=A0AAV4CC83_9GAST|nr:hypothetical protein PoB_005557800 [Plakobranchus ocellatus]
MSAILCNAGHDMIMEEKQQPDNGQLLKPPALIIDSLAKVALIYHEFSRGNWKRFPISLPSERGLGLGGSSPNVLVNVISPSASTLAHLNHMSWSPLSYHQLLYLEIGRSSSHVLVSFVLPSTSILAHILATCPCQPCLTISFCT